MFEVRSENEPAHKIFRHRFEDQHECGYNPAANNRPNRYDKLGQNQTNNSGGVKNTLLNFFSLGGGSNKQQSPPTKQQGNKNNQSNQSNSQQQEVS